MKILFVVADVFLSEPLGLMQLSAICKSNGWDTRLATIRRHNILNIVNIYQPDIIAYSMMSPDVQKFKAVDRAILENFQKGSAVPCRIMGGPHASYFPDILREMNLDAICIGEGDNAIVSIIERYMDDDDFSGIPNVVCRTSQDLDLKQKELIHNLDDLPFVDREIIFDAVPYYRHIQLKSFLTSRGCPYKCTYCHNSAFNKEFKGYGLICRRFSVDRVIEEIKYTQGKYPNLKLIRFGDDTFAHKVDPWLEIFADKYRKEINIPFYCLMRSNAFSDDMARLLKEAGCVSLSMSIEHGDEEIRNTILKRGISNEKVQQSFEYAHKYGIKVQANAMLGIPGTTIKDDFKTIEFIQKQKIYLPTIGIFCPFPGTELTEYAIKIGAIDDAVDFSSHYQTKSLLKSYTEHEKMLQVNMMYLGMFFVLLPKWFNTTFKLLIRIPISKVYFLVTKLFLMIRFWGLFPKMVPYNPLVILKIFFDSVSYFKTKKVK
ncbi:MAG: B12-binding domain-containing radical SAM protein [Proteobacteria bacterium]|nr:B12-binding domain-containing radical SAM protein [Pseudomonadota bacterium]